MRLEDQVTNRELSVVLKKIGIKQDSLFFYTLGGVVSRLEALPILDSNYSAFTVAELGEMLPDCTFSLKVNVDPKWLCSCDEPSVEDSERADSEANARAKLLINLIENKWLII